MIRIVMPEWLVAVLGLQVGLGIFLGCIALVGKVILTVGGPSLARSEARLARNQSGGEQHGWHPGQDTGGLLTAAGRWCFDHAGSVRRVLVGQFEGRRIRMAEFLHTDGSRLPTASVNNLIAIELPTRLPHLVVHRGPLTDLGLLSFQELELQLFEGESGTFNRAYTVGSPDPRYSSAVLHPRMMEWLLAHREVNFRIHANLIVAYAPEPWTVPQALATLPVLSGVVDLLPFFVLDDFGQPLPSGS
ncbi:hypothetical protein [Kribbella sp. CA-293567]|uniref:hypothetical protein n=1 Tax=Kribbella sp. CA-293567 TaxID=3002436 RepID=UPI0022DCF240|nr:hypothetical protein [Kribbella sp. CA-293567]WBQ02352.1 hypothetical protein OX958_20435 [Kribbella sp. CA-293567]